MALFRLEPMWLIVFLRRCCFRRKASVPELYENRNEGSGPTTRCNFVEAPKLVFMNAGSPPSGQSTIELGAFFDGDWSNDFQDPNTQLLRVREPSTQSFERLTSLLQLPSLQLFNYSRNGIRAGLIPHHARQQ